MELHGTRLEGAVGAQAEVGGFDAVELCTGGTTKGRLTNRADERTGE